MTKYVTLIWHTKSIGHNVLILRGRKEREHVLDN